MKNTKQFISDREAINFGIVTVHCHAKVNLFLDITGVRSSNNYHTINSVMQSVSLHDTLRVKLTEDGVVNLSCNTNLPVDRRNVVSNIANEFLGYYNFNTGSSIGADILLTKRIPAQAGLGGGSTDGAGIIRCLDYLLGTQLPDETMMRFSSEFGADIPFCINGGTAVCEGIGEKVTPIKIRFRSPSAIVIIKPFFSVSTVEAYKLYDETDIPPRPYSFTSFVDSITSGNADGTVRNAYNIFEQLIENSEKIADIKKELISGGAVHSLLSGSGSAVFGVFPDFVLADKFVRNAPKGKRSIYICGFENRGIRIFDRQCETL